MRTTGESHTLPIIDWAIDPRKRIVEQSLVESSIPNIYAELIGTM